jgi:hypothetical protein
MNETGSNSSKLSYYILISIFLVSCGSKNSHTNNNSSINKELKPKSKPVDKKDSKSKTVKTTTISESESESELNGYKLTKISKVDFTKLLKNNFVHSEMVSPDKKVNLEFVTLDPTANSLVIKRNGRKPVKVKEYYQTLKVFWSKDSSKIAFVNTDDYAGSGDDLLVIINLKTLQIIKIDLDGFTKNIKTGDRNMFSCSLSGWQNNKKLIFQVSIDYLGESGHPGINSNRKAKLGKNFDKQDPVYLGSYIISLKK